MFIPRELRIKYATCVVKQFIEKKDYKRAIDVIDFFMLKGYLAGENKLKKIYPLLRDQDFKKFNSINLPNPYNKEKTGIKLYLIKEVDHYYQYKMRVFKLQKMGF
jgi:hypothetical protein